MIFCGRQLTLCCVLTLPALQFHSNIKRYAKQDANIGIVQLLFEV